ncbi:MAG: PD-(D/E)XK nuclease family protein [Candidatus Diapherotrites archaeon]|nr:PD-(D/E)XK nuclease family protein [Candidatus Diapherotrites archaeon]
MANYSHSRLSTFEQCRYRYKLQYIDRVKVDVPTTVEAFLGDLVHRALEKLYVDLGFQKMNSEKEILSFYDNLWDREWTDSILIVKNEYRAENYKKMGQNYISDYYTHYHPFDQMTVIGIETQDMLTLPDGNKYHVRIDRLGCRGSTYFVCDYKTNSRMKNKAELDEDRQLAMYSLWVKNMFPDAKKVVLLWHMLAFDKEAVSERTEEQLEKLQQDTMKIISELESCTEFPTSVSGLCKYCSYKKICPSFSHKVELEEKMLKKFKEDDGVKLVDEYSKLLAEKNMIENKAGEVKADLVEFARQKEIDMVYGSNEKASVKEYKKIVYPQDKEKITRVLKEKGLYDENSMVCYSKLNSKILKNDIDKQIIGMVEEEKDYRVSLSKKP